MKILIVTWYFPPSNTIAAIRLGHLARDLLAGGHDVQVLTAADQPYPQVLDLPFPPERVHYTGWSDINAAPTRIVHRLARRRRLVRSAGADVAPPAAAPAARPAKESRASWAWRHFTNIPDARLGWMPPAVREGLALVARWRPDVVFASGPPHTTLVIGRRLAGRARLPLVVELRDRWFDDPYEKSPALREWIDRRLEAWVVGGAGGLSTVSEPWAETYRARYGKPVATVYNGYDPALIGDDEAPGAAGEAGLVIGYFGGIYVGRRDPGPLFAALSRPELAGTAVRVVFHGTPPDLVFPLAEREGVRDRVSVLPMVPNAEAVRLQRRVDVLLLMQWNNPLEQGNVPGKLFEYLAARRPILGLGLEDGVPATIIRSRGAGAYANDPAAIAAQLAAWAGEKRADGRLPPSPPSARAGFSRPEQSKTLERLLETVVDGGAGS